MSIRNLEVKGFERAYPSTAVHNKVKELANNILKSTIYDVENMNIFNMNAKRRRFNVGGRDTFTLFLNATPNERTTANVPRGMDAYPTMFGIEVAHENRLPSLEGEGLQTLSTPEGEPVVVYIPERNELYALHDFQAYPTTKFLALIEALFTLIRKEVLDKKGYENSWVHSSNKEALLKKFRERMEAQVTSLLRDDKERLQQREREVVQYQQNLKSSYDQIARLMKSIEVAESGAVDVQAKLVKEMENIASHPRVTDLRIEGDFITVSIPDIIATDERDRQFYIGNFQVKINTSNSEVNFFGDNPRQSHWTAQDPHPHVNGRNGQACLGNVAGTIAELCSQNELYALVMVCIDFLENANIQDSAGKNVVRWDEVKDGKVIKSQLKRCERCERDTTDETHQVATTFDGNGNVGGHETWCEDCRGDYATWSDHVDCVVDDEIYSEIENFFDEEEEDEE